MCRRNQLLGWCLAAFGLGILLGAWMEGGFLCFLLGAGMMTLGWGVIRRN